MATATLSSALFLSVLILLEGGLMQSALGQVAGPASEPAASGPTAAAADCMTLLYGMVDCLSYVTTGSNLTKPDKPCCGELKTLVTTNETCLCELLANSSSSGLDIDIKRALKLPSICKVDTPPPSACSLLGYPVAGAPTEGPTSAEGQSPGGAPSSGSSSTTTGASSPNSGTFKFRAISVPYIVALLFAFASLIV